MTKLQSESDLEKLRKQILSKRDPKKPCISICSGTGCIASGCEKVDGAFREELAKQKLKDKVDIMTTGCPGFCERGPIVVIKPEGIFYQLVEAKDIPEIVSETVVKKKVIDRLLYTDPQTGNKIVLEKDVPFYNKQNRILMDSNSLLDPAKIEDYLAIGGYSAFLKVLSGMKPEQVIETVKQSGLRGRGGAGFPTGVKWETCRRSKGDVKYVICNADEGDPGAFANRGLLEGNPHSIIEGMLIGAYGIGATEGFVYVRHEYPLAVKNVKIAIDQMRALGLLGKNILGSKFSFDLKVVQGAGAFICGEETALMASIEGKKGEPKQRPPFPAERGIWGRPTNINNVETWANVPMIMNKGADWFANIGTSKSKGTKIFSLVGKINNTGLVEVSLGTPLKTLIYDIGGGIPKGKRLKSVQCGGPSGGCVPAESISVPIDYEALKELGAMMGSGGLIVMDEDTCMVDVAKFFSKFLLDESCGKCMTCREGLERLLEITTDLTEGKGKMEDLTTLEELGKLVQQASMCGLGQTAPNPVLTTLRYFRPEYEAHVHGKCPAKVCKALISYHIDPEKCTACGLCKKNCPADAIIGSKGMVHIIDQSKCIKCDTCFDVCPEKFDAVRKISGEKVPPAVPQGTAVKKKVEKKEEEAKR
jgi:NADH:ubiquinone oxidoreductase subunit F (NADH-binding)/(2Fe-2S) ferredoxin/NAD-dependent dihydropyrimidine dehydrogenase PreA subunit